MEHLDTHMVKTYLSLYLRFEFSGKSHKLMAFNSFSKNRKLKLYGCCSDSAKSTRHWKDRILSLRGNNIVKEEQMGRNNECEDSVNTTLTIFRTTDSSLLTLPNAIITVSQIALLKSPHFGLCINLFLHFLFNRKSLKKS